MNGKSYAESNYSYDILGPKIKKFINKIFLKKILNLHNLSFLREIFNIDSFI